MHKFFIYTLILYLTGSGWLCSNCCAEAAPLQIAVVGPFSGAYSAYGSQLLAGAMQAAIDINNQGGINNVEIEIMPLDDQCDPDMAIARADEIIRSNKYHAVIGHVCSAASLATAKVYAQQNILVVSPTSTNPKLTQNHINTFFRMSGNDLQQSVTAAEFIAKRLGSKRIAVLHDNELYSKELADLVAEHLIHLETTPAMYQTVSRGTRNFTSLIKKMANLNVDAIYFAGLYPEVAALANALNTLQMQIPLISADAIALEQFAAELNSTESANNVMLTFATDPNQLVSSRNLLQAMQENNFSTTGYALYAYASVQVIASAMQNTNKLEGKDLANWLHHHPVDTVLGKKSWDTNGDITDHEFKMYAWQTDKDKLVLKKLLPN